MNEILVVTTLGLLALAVGAVSWTRTNSSGRQCRSRTAFEGPVADDGGGAGFDVISAPGSDLGASDCSGADTGAGCDGGGGGD